MTVEEFEYEPFPRKIWDCKAAFFRHRKLISILVLLILVAGFIANLLYNHYQNKNLNKLLQAEQANRKLNQLVGELEGEYRQNISAHIKNGQNNLTFLHEELKQNVLEKFDDAEKPTAEFDLVTLYKRNLNHAMENWFADVSSHFQTKLEVGENLVTLLTQKYYHSLGTVKDASQTGEHPSLRTFEMQKRQMILKEFQTKSNFPVGSPAYNNLKKELQVNLNQVTTWNSTLAKAYDQVRKTYQEEYNRALSQPRGKELIPSEVSLEFHEKVSQITIVKCVQQKLVPVNPQVQQELRLYLDKIYEKKIKDNIVIGIDFGETYTRSAVYYQGKVQMIPHYDQDGKIYDSMASYVGGHEHDEYVGQSAQRIVETSNNFTLIFCDIKSLLWGFSNSSMQSFTLNDTENDSPKVSRRRFEFLVQNVVAILFNQVHKNAERFIGASIHNCVVTAPHWFLDSYKYAIIIANNDTFTNVTILNENFAAAATLELQQGQWSSAKRVFFAEFDTRWWYFSLYEGSKVNFRDFASKDFNGSYMAIDKLVDHCINRFCETERLSMNQESSDDIAGHIRRRRVFESCNKVINLLNKEEMATVTVAELFGGKNLAVEVTKAELEIMFKNLLDLIPSNFNDVLKNAKLKKEDVDEVIIAGEYSGMPKIREIVGNYFPGKKIIISGVPSENVIAYGAAVRGAMISAEMIRVHNKNL